MKYTPPYDVDFSLRDPAADVDAQFPRRWSPRSFKKKPIPEKVLTAIFDAARWSPSAFNEQPWLFVTSSGEEDFETFLKLLVDSNQEWGVNASLIGFIFAKRHHEYNRSDNRYYFFDSGAAWMAMTLQARKFGLYTHGMGGIRRRQTYEVLKVPEDSFEVVCGFALGFLDTPEHLSDDLKKTETPTPRKSLDQIWKIGGY